MSDDTWSWWRQQLAHQAGECEAPETTPGTPFAGYFVTERYVSLPHAIPTRKGGSVQRGKVKAPVAIWLAEAMTDWDGIEYPARWQAQITLPNVTRSYTHTDEIDELFGQVCREAITYEQYEQMTSQIAEWRSGYEPR